jgi:predicted ArsR family transcriptional regulator
VANGNGNSTLKNLGVTAVPISALGLLALLALQVQKDAAVALDVARQHGEAFTQIRQQIQVLQEADRIQREDVRERTKLLYNSTDAKRDHAYLNQANDRMQKDLDACLLEIKEHKKNDH